MRQLRIRLEDFSGGKDPNSRYRVAEYGIIEIVKGGGLIDKINRVLRSCGNPEMQTLRCASDVGKYDKFVNFIIKDQTGMMDGETEPLDESILMDIANEGNEEEEEEEEVLCLEDDDVKKVYKIGEETEEESMDDNGMTGEEEGENCDSSGEMKEEMREEDEMINGGDDDYDELTLEDCQLGDDLKIIEEVVVSSPVKGNNPPMDDSFQSPLELDTGRMTPPSSDDYDSSFSPNGNFEFSTSTDDSDVLKGIFLTPPERRDETLSLSPKRIPPKKNGLQKGKARGDSNGQNLLKMKEKTNEEPRPIPRPPQAFSPKFIVPVPLPPVSDRSSKRKQSHPVPVRPIVKKPRIEEIDVPPQDESLTDEGSPDLTKLTVKTGKQKNRQEIRKLAMQKMLINGTASPEGKVKPTPTFSVDFNDEFSCVKDDHLPYDSPANELCLKGGIFHPPPPPRSETSPRARKVSEKQRLALEDARIAAQIGEFDDVEEDNEEDKDYSPSIPDPLDKMVNLNPSTSKKKQTTPPKKKRNPKLSKSNIAGTTVYIPDEDERNKTHTRCNICNVWFENEFKQRIRYHVLYHCPIKQYQCGLCKFSHHELGKIKRHQSTAHKDAPLDVLDQPKNHDSVLTQACFDVFMKKCFPFFDTGKLSIGRSINYPNQVEERLKCEICDKRVYKSLTAYHIVDQHQTSFVYNCNLCNFKSIYPRRLVIHYQICHDTDHKGDFYACNIDFRDSTLFLIKDIFPAFIKLDDPDCESELREMALVVNADAIPPTRKILESEQDGLIDAVEIDAPRNVQCELCSTDHSKTIVPADDIYDLILHMKSHMPPAMDQWCCAQKGCTRTGKTKLEVDLHMYKDHDKLFPDKVINRWSLLRNEWTKMFDRCFPSLSHLFPPFKGISIDHRIERYKL